MKEETARYGDLVDAIIHTGDELHYELDSNGKKFKFVLKHMPSHQMNPDWFWGRVLLDGEVIDEHESESICECLDWLCDSVEAYEGGWAWN